MSFKKGFTLIELLVVVAIIGILVAVVLAALNSAKGKGGNAGVQTNLANMRAEGELVYYNNSNSYATVCADGSVIKALAAAASADGGSVLATNAAEAAGKVVCDNAAGSWIIQAALSIPVNGNNYWCVDYTGTSKADNTTAVASAVICPP